MRLYRATLMHTPGNPFQTPGTLQALDDGALLVMLSAAEHALELCREALTRERDADARARVGAERLD